MAYVIGTDGKAQNVCAAVPGFLTVSGIILEEMTANKNNFFPPRFPFLPTRFDICLSCLVYFFRVFLLSSMIIRYAEKVSLSTYRANFDTCHGKTGVVFFFSFWFSEIQSNV